MEIESMVYLMSSDRGAPQAPWKLAACFDRGRLREVQGSVTGLFPGPVQPFHPCGLLCRVLQAAEADEKDRRLQALTFARDPALIAATLEYALAPEVRAQDTPSLILGVAQRGGASLQAAWSFLRT